MSINKLDDPRLHNWMKDIYKGASTDIRNGVNYDGTIITHIKDVEIHCIWGWSAFNDLEDIEFIEILETYEREDGEDVDVIRLLDGGVQYCIEHFGYQPLEVENLTIHTEMFYLYNHCADMVKRGNAPTIEAQQIHQEKIAEWVLLEDEGLIVQIESLTDDFGSHGVFQLTDFGIEYCKKYFGHDPKKLKKVSPRSIRQYHKMEMYKPFIQRMLDGDLFGPVYRDFEIMLTQRGKRPGSIAAYKANLTRRYEMAAQHVG